jgi:hypothetical protein
MTGPGQPAPGAAVTRGAAHPDGNVSPSSPCIRTVSRRLEMSGLFKRMRTPCITMVVAAWLFGLVGALDFHGETFSFFSTDTQGLRRTRTRGPVEALKERPTSDCASDVPGFHALHQPGPAFQARRCAYRSHGPTDACDALYGRRRALISPNLLRGPPAPRTC